MIWYGDRVSTGRVTLGIPAGLLSRKLPASPDYGRLSTRERDPGNKLVRRMSGAEPAARRGSGELSGEQRRVCIFAINKRIFKSFLL